ncbi:MAG: hypothetical protein A3C30_01385 [Candidatus Levybacteria bacterium RIFCSPHIGHO2_02_FULL_40_18]|nr:MAG: hypothetical protein A2869_00950 [Candidatus Levybacteria bacterium RIFCSPHIGHO2_01_FULL_40_58]OGH26649.1 MAG: hypothetical protein A3C30_01385 [Candidatus Levybacteria bacterium RIFCSPHIGHO2_02_FULL_40_18]OGH31178.1 MAG: hypothetical protein A3E43_00220 [Candidatus Levybacteria bacterium RIFCSPHIGHO2_12_FULL_40_31]OGH39860.1 MAG: hypothetical protein A2894_03725 [Candidatus Levybacteria bacterium RIFCSPLOWO2_01_FULL_40_64]OGH48884.1 MAG: hypothetical protein A3I54_04830 [Candidatus Lev
MDRQNLFLLFLFISLFLESTVISFPFIFLISLIYYIFYPSTRTLITAVLAGLFIDILSVSIIGQTSLAILISYLLIEFYKKAFDTRDWRILLILLFTATYIYSNIFPYENNLLIYLSLFVSIGIIIFNLTHDNNLWLK